MYDIYFMCQYDMRRYPFDTQQCSVDIVLTAVHDNFCKLNVQNFSYEGDLDLRLYFIRYKLQTCFSLASLTLFCQEQDNVHHYDRRPTRCQSRCVPGQKTDECAFDCVSTNNPSQHHGSLFCLLSEILL